MRINQNIAAFNAYRNLSNTESMLNKSLEKLSSGFRINRAADDAAGLVISQGLRAQISGLKQATRNAQDGISVVQTAEGALNEVQNMLQRMRDLSVQAANTGSTDATAATAIQSEYDGLAAEITRVTGATKFGTTQLLNGTAGTSGTVTFQVGANASATDQISVALPNLTTLSTSANLSTAAGATAAITALDTAISTVSSTRGTLGGIQNRFESGIANLQVATENLSASESRIRDTDMASEMTNFTKNQILQQAGTAMLAQANSVPQSILKLIQ